MSASGRGGRQNTPSRRVDVDLGKLHASRKYDRQALHAKVPWYRNTFEDAEAPPTTQLPPEPVSLDAPLVIPQELRPLSHRRRYLRTIQLIDDPIPEVALAPAIVLDAPPCEKPATVIPSLKRAKSGLPVKLSGSVSFPVLAAPTSSSCSPSPSRHANHRKNPRRDVGHLVEGGEADGDNYDDDDDDNDEQRRQDSASKRAEMQRRRETALCATKSMGQLTPLTHPPSSSSHSPLSRRRDRERSRRVSVEEAQDLGNSECYFGPTAKTQFFETYRQLCAKPYLFIEDPTLVSPRHVRDRDGYLDVSASTQSKFMAAFPSSSYLKGVERELAAVGTGVEHSESHLPSDDKLSPRSQFLTAAVTRPYMSSAFMLRTAMTKVYDFSFQSLGDEFIIEFAKCLRNELPFVEEINVRDNRLSDDGLDALLTAIARGSAMLHLHRLDISQNTVGAKSALTLRSFVATSHCSLRALLVENADIDDNECAAFMTAFEKNLSIQELWMSRNGIGKSEHLNVVQPHFVTGGEAIASMLHRNLVLVHLELAWNYLRLESSITLAKSMFENRTLVQLNVAYNACGDAGAMAFGEALHVNQSLEVLNLSYNSIGCKGAQVLAQALRVNRTLRSLVLDGNCIGREGGQQLLFALCENKNAIGCDISLHACNLTSSVSHPTAHIAMSSSNSSSSQTAPSLLASTTRGPPPPAPVVSPNDINLAAMPAYGASSSSVFNAKEPTGRYTLHMKDPYDKMMALELLRLAALKKGCRFLRLDHRATPSAAKRAIQLVRKERKPSVATSTKPSQRSESSGFAADEDPLETLGLDALFTDVMDRDHSGSVDRHEVMSVLNRIGLFPKVEHLDSMLAKCDFDQSGAIERGHEFSAFLFHAVFQLIDSDASGKIDADEVEEAFKMLGIDAYDEKEILEAIAMYDISGDGEMEESEFVAFMKDKLLDQIKTQLLVSPCSSSGGSVDDDHAEPAVAAVLVETTTQKPWSVPDDGVLEVDFLYERQAFASTEEAHRYAKMPQASIEKLIHNIIDLADSKSEQEDLFHVAVHDSDLKFTASQAYQLLDACGLLKPVERKIESIARMLPQMLTPKESQVLVSRTLTLRQRCRLKAEMGSAYSVAMGNPTAHYSLDLSKPKDRATMAKIAEVAQSEKLFSKLKSGRSDTSQHGNWENFRNEELDGEKCVLTTAFFHVMPVRGKLSFDYVSTMRPKKGTAPLSDRRFAQLIAELQTSIQIASAVSGDTSSSTAPPQVLAAADEASAARKKSDGAVKATSSSAATIGSLRPLPFSKVLSVRTKQTEFWDKTRNSVLQKAAWQFAATATATASSSPDDASWTVAMSKTATKETVALKLVQIESSICDRWLSCDQAAEIIACMPPQFFARPETARILFARLIDIGDFVLKIFDSLVPEDQYVCAKSLGWLNIFNPMAPERHYSLDVSICDEREMTKLLVQLAIAEPGENWINQSFSMVRGEPGIPGWKLPVRWEKEDEKDGGGVNRSGYLEVEYYSGGDRGCAPVPAFRKSLLTSVLGGTRLFCV